VAIPESFSALFLRPAALADIPANIADILLAKDVSEVEGIDAHSSSLNEGTSGTESFTGGRLKFIS
tara:strand:- start:435 stop:632 length:198 start_codon:yes stop_codon:yes gene_type:complete